MVMWLSVTLFSIDRSWAVCQCPALLTCSGTLGWGAGHSQCPSSLSLCPLETQGDDQLDSAMVTPSKSLTYIYSTIHLLLCGGSTMVYDRVPWRTQEGFLLKVPWEILVNAVPLNLWGYFSKIWAQASNYIWRASKNIWPSFKKQKF